MVRHETAAAIHFPRRHAAVFAHSLDQFDQGLLTLGKVRHHCRPVIHLSIDIDREPAAPDRREVLIPDPLEVQRQRSRTRACDHEVPPELEEALDFFLSVDM